MKEKILSPQKEKHLLFDTLPDSYSVCKFIHLFPCVTSIVGQQIVRISINIGWTCFCLYAFKKLTQRHTLWWRAVDENPNKPKMN